MSGKILILDDEESIRTILAALLKPLGHQIFLAESAEQALEILQVEPCDLVLSDLRMDGMGGMELLRLARSEWPKIKFFLMSAYADLETLAEAMRLGAVDFMAKPLQHTLLRSKIASAMKEVLSQNSAQLELASNDGMIGSSPAMLEVKSLGAKAARGDVSVLIQGESGTGKEVMARWIHEHSPRANKPFVAVNCGAIPENLVESELFGFEKGAFTGAHQAKAGKFELAHGGTLFLDEIGELPLHAQVKILRALQERQIDRVGSSQSIAVDVRIICATHRNLSQMVVDGKFREDLYYRLNVVPLELPALRERGADLGLLAQSILQRLNDRYGSQFQLTSSQLDQLTVHRWPGNVRELENVLERSVVLSQGDLELLLPKRETNSSAQTMVAQTLGQAKMESEKAVILEALEKCRWNKTQTAEFLGISRRSLLYKIKAFEIE